MTTALIMISLALIVFSIVINGISFGEAYQDWKIFCEEHLTVEEYNKAVKEIAEDMRPWAAYTTSILLVIPYVLLYIIGGLASGYFMMKLFHLIKIKNLIYKENNEQHK